MCPTADRWRTHRETGKSVLIDDMERTCDCPVQRQLIKVADSSVSASMEQSGGEVRCERRREARGELQKTSSTVRY